MSTITERVAAGAAFLDEHDPQWWRADVERAIGLDGLDLASSSSCVLGQRCPVEVLAKHAGVRADDEDELSVEWYQAYHAFAQHLSGLDRPYVFDWADGLGFTANDAEWGSLTAEWKRVITERRAAA